MLEQNLRDQLQGYLETLQHPVVLKATLDSSEKSRELEEFLREIAALSDKVSVTADGASRHVPSFEITGVNKGRICFAALPLGHEFTSFVLALLQAGGHPVKWDEETINAVSRIDKKHEFTAYISLGCQICPDVVQTLNAMAIHNPHVSAVIVDGALFKDEVEALGIMTVPAVRLNETDFFNGRMSISEILSKLGLVDEKKVAAGLNKKDRFDVLVVGGGPAGTTAAIYSARKGLRTGLVAERIGGQILDTLSIENFVSIPHTEGPRLAGALMEHMKVYDIDVMENNVVQGIAEHDKDFSLALENGATLRAGTVILASGARWRKMNVPGEEAYLKKGVVFCPHCDGPLFKGKDVAVIGGGNSGVEAAIDLSRITRHVTLIEFLENLKADTVLQNKLRSLDNVTVITNARVTAVSGDEKALQALEYIERDTQKQHSLAVSGVFVQIGLMPNSEWIGSFVGTNDRGEIVIDEKCRTSRPGVFAAGDVSTVPYKQIVIALGEGAKASLSAFDYLVRNS